MGIEAEQGNARRGNCKIGFKRCCQRRKKGIKIHLPDQSGNLLKGLMNGGKGDPEFRDRVIEHHGRGGNSEHLAQKSGVPFFVGASQCNGLLVDWSGDEGVAHSFAAEFSRRME